MINKVNENNVNFILQPLPIQKFSISLQDSIQAHQSPSCTSKLKLYLFKAWYFIKNLIYSCLGKNQKVEKPYISIDSVVNLPLMPSKITPPNKPYSVGELGKKWEFPSDHLPVGASIGDAHFAFWNILNTNDLDNIQDQGLKGSAITTENVKEEEEELTSREKRTIDYTLEMIDHETYPRSVIALEEVGEAVFDGLVEKLPDHMVMVPDAYSEDVFIYDSNRFEQVGFESTPYTAKEQNEIMQLTLKEKETNQIFHFVQSHVPGGPHLEKSKKEFASQVVQKFNPEAITIVMGDMNGSPALFLDAFTKEAQIQKKSLSLKGYVPLYPTHINTYQQACWVDNLYIANPHEELQVKSSEDPKELFNDLEPSVELLQSFK